jgi:hypothetical protein
MPVSIRVPEGGMQMPVMAPTDVKPGQLYILGLSNGQPGGVVLARETPQGMIELGPMPENITQDQISRVTLLPAIKRVEVEGQLVEESPSAMRVVEVMSLFGSSHNVFLDL